MGIWNFRRSFTMGITWSRFASWSCSLFRPAKSSVRVDIEGLAAELRAHQNIAVLTGAGISAESGIPTFRDLSDGVWNTHDIISCGTSWGFKRHPGNLWRMIHEMADEKPMPNMGHKSLADLEKKGKNVTIITQNIDGLHQ